MLILKETFDGFDNDGNGTIDREEVKAIMNKLGLDPRERDLDKMIANIDINKDGLIDFDEFKQLYQMQHESINKDYFDVFDRNDSGSISKAELRRGFKEFGIELFDKEVDEIMQEFDLNHDNHITFEEFEKIFND